MILTPFNRLAYSAQPLVSNVKKIEYINIIDWDLAYKIIQKEKQTNKNYLYTTATIGEDLYADAIIIYSNKKAENEIKTYLRNIFGALASTWGTPCIYNSISVTSDGRFLAYPCYKRVKLMDFKIQELYPSWPNLRKMINL